MKVNNCWNYRVLGHTQRTTVIRSSRSKAQVREFSCSVLSDDVSLEQPPWLNEKAAVPYGYWAAERNRLAYCDWLGVQLRYRRFMNFYRLSHQVVEANRGSGLLNRHNQSVSSVLVRGYQQFNWRFWEYKDVKKHFWGSAENQMDFLDWLGRQIGIRRYSDWGRVRLHEFESRGFSAILFYHNHSVLQTVVDVYSAYYFSPWTFDKPMNEYWKLPRHQAAMLIFLENKLKIQDIEDWKRVTHSRLKATRLLSAVLKLGGLDKLLASFYPDKDWSPLRIRVKQFQIV